MSGIRQREDSAAFDQTNDDTHLTSPSRPLCQKKGVDIDKESRDQGTIALVP
jgi:hypothetical protein